MGNKHGKTRGIVLAAVILTLGLAMVSPAPAWAQDADSRIAPRNKVIRNGPV